MPGNRSRSRARRRETHPLARSLLTEQVELVLEMSCVLT
jgi:hypothetical protein